MEKQACSKVINNAFYEELNEDWYTAYDHPIALLRAENAVRNPWILEEIGKRCGLNARVLDIGCGGGLLTNTLAKEGHVVTGIDLSETSLEIAKAHDQLNQVTYLKADAYHLPFKEESFDAVCAMDVLEHVEHPERVIAEASRVLKPNGIFFFHTFNRNLLSYLFIIKGVEWCVKNTPKNMHVYSLFIKPKQLRLFCESSDFHVEKFVGLRPCLTRSFFQMVLQRRVPPNFSFCFSKSLSTGYCGIARKKTRL